MTANRLKIAYLCDLSPLDSNTHSGGNARIFEALGTHAGDVTILPNVWAGAEPLRQLILTTPDSISIRARWRAHLLLRRTIARGITQALARDRYDVLFGAYALHALAGVRPPYPLVTAYTSDAVQTVYRMSEVGQAHKRMFLLGPLMDGWIERREREVLHSADLLLWPSRWLLEGVQDRYDTDRGRAHLVPWGANIQTPPPPVPKALHPAAPLELLVIGRDWVAKGGPTAFDTMMALRNRGRDTRLTIIGCDPPEAHRNEWTTVHPHLDKSVPAQLALFESALSRAHFLVQPSYESYGFAFCEAAALGLPALCLDVGGVPVRDQVNGHALPPGSGPGDFADHICSYIDAPDRYAALSRSARTEFETRLNWDAWGTRTADLLRDAVARKPA